jgi:hypothetical protein
MHFAFLKSAENSAFFIPIMRDLREKKFFSHPPSRVAHATQVIFHPSHLHREAKVPPFTGLLTEKREPKHKQPKFIFKLKSLEMCRTSYLNRQNTFFTFYDTNVGLVWWPNFVVELAEKLSQEFGNTGYKKIKVIIHLLHL